MRLLIIKGPIMAKRHNSGVLNRLAGKKLVFNGKFGYGTEDSLKAMATAQQGTVRDVSTPRLIIWSLRT